MSETPILVYGTHCFWLFVSGLVAFLIPTSCFFVLRTLVYAGINTKAPQNIFLNTFFLKFFRVVTATLGITRGDNAYVQKHWRAFSPQQAGAILEKVFSKFLGYFLFYFPISISNPLECSQIAFSFSFECLDLYFKNLICRTIL